MKLFWDCRTDSTALYHQFGVQLANVLDLQVCPKTACAIFKEFHASTASEFVARGAVRGPTVQDRGSTTCERSARVLTVLS